jgi:hypothetical protein
MVALVFLMLGAGSESTTHLISGWVYELVKIPPCGTGLRTLLLETVASRCRRLQLIAGQAARRASSITFANGSTTFVQFTWVAVLNFSEVKVFQTSNRQMTIPSSLNLQPLVLARDVSGHGSYPAWLIRRGIKSCAQIYHEATPP